MSFLLYPKVRHSRREAPPHFASYKSYKPYLRAEFDKRCVYCCKPDSVAGAEGFGADHYRPVSRFPELRTEYANLFYCCNPCNSRKGSYWPTGGNEKTHFVPNPCEHEMYRHLRFNGPEVAAKSQAGQVALELLALNDPLTVVWRERALQAIASIRVREADIRAKALTVARSLKSGKISAEDAAIRRARLDVLRQQVAAALAFFDEVPASV